jgi:two-component system sensor histidine kinase TctE
VTLCSLAAIGAVFFGVRRGLGPVDKLRDELHARSHVDLSPVDEKGAVDELRPVLRELNQMLSRLQSSQSLQARFTANAAHQLRTPIAGLITQLDLVRSDAISGETHLARARDGAARVARLAQQLLSLAAADPASNPVVASEPADLADIVRRHAQGWVRSATARSAEIEFDLDPAPVKVDPVLVGELAANLVDNATRYGAHTVRVSTRHWGHKSLLEITDDGPGIPENERSRIFERFYRIDNESTEGSGLGLAIVHEIAQRHGASVEVTDGPEKNGIRIGVLFPS